MPLIPFPNIPDFPGVPSLPRSVTIPTTLGQLINLGLDALQQAVFIWGVYDESGARALEPDSFMGLDERNDAPVSNHPVEKGSFSAYNKVQTPFDCRVRLVFGGDKQSRAAALAKIDQMLNSVELFSVVTPEKTYLNVNLINKDMRRHARDGVSMLTVDLWFAEIRLTPAAEYSSPKDPSGADPVSDGQVQAIPVPDRNSIPATDLFL